MEEVVLRKAQEAADVGALVSPQEGLDALPAPVRSAKVPVLKALATAMDDRIGQLVAARPIAVLSEEDHHKMLLGLDVHVAR